MDAACFSRRSGGEQFFFRIFFCFQNLDALYRPVAVAGKPFVLEDLCLDMGTSVASALTAETIFKPPPPVGAGGGYMFSGRPSVRASVIHVVVLCFRDISSIS